MTKAPRSTPAEMSKRQSDNTNNATKKSVTQWLQTDLGRSVGPNCCGYSFTGPTFPLSAAVRTDKMLNAQNNVTEPIA